MANGCTGDVLSSAILARMLLLFHRRRLFAPLFPRGSVNACSSDAPVLMHGDRENRVELRDIFMVRQVRICLCMAHVYNMRSPSQAI